MYDRACRTQCWFEMRRLRTTSKNSWPPLILIHSTDAVRLPFQVLAKLNGMYQWAFNEPRVAGFSPWHYNSRTKNQAPGCPCDLKLGAEAMPAVLDLLRLIGTTIVNNTAS